MRLVRGMFDYDPPSTHRTHRNYLCPGHHPLSLVNIINVHVDSGLQPYECQYCSKRFGRSDVRNKHVQSTHEGDKMGTAGRRRRWVCHLLYTRPEHRAKIRAPYRTIAEADGKEKTPEPGDDVEGHSAGGGKARSYSMPGGSRH